MCLLRFLFIASGLLFVALLMCQLLTLGVFPIQAVPLYDLCFVYDWIRFLLTSRTDTPCPIDRSTNLLVLVSCALFLGPFFTLFIYFFCLSSSLHLSNMFSLLFASLCRCMTFVLPFIMFPQVFCLFCLLYVAFFLFLTRRHPRYPFSRS